MANIAELAAFRTKISRDAEILQSFTVTDLFPPFFHCSIMFLSRASLQLLVFLFLLITHASPFFSGKCWDLLISLYFLTFHLLSEFSKENEVGCWGTLWLVRFLLLKFSTLNGKAKKKMSEVRSGFPVLGGGGGGSGERKQIPSIY